MTIVLDSQIATPDDVAEILGVPKKRAKWLKGLSRSHSAFSIKAKNGTRVAKNRRKNIRGKAKKTSH